MGKFLKATIDFYATFAMHMYDRSLLALQRKG
jgi:hypothetical protein